MSKYTTAQRAEIYEKAADHLRKAANPRSKSDWTYGCVALLHFTGMSREEIKGTSTEAITEMACYYFPEFAMMKPSRKPVFSDWFGWFGNAFESDCHNHRITAMLMAAAIARSEA